jgi:hypothetical protein
MNRTCSLCLKPTGLVLGVVLQCAVAITHEPAHTLGYHLFGFAGEGVPASATTDGMIHHLVTIQWPSNG